MITKTIPNYSRYTITECGEVWDTKQQKYPSWIKNGGYACVNLYNDAGKKVLEKVHRCVGLTYIPKPENSTNLLLHIDLDRTNNSVSNLRWKVKGKSDIAHTRFHTLNGKKYHMTELEAIGEAAGLTWACTRQRLVDGWEKHEILQGHRDSEVFYVDDMKFVGYHTVKQYRDMLDKDVKSKAKYQLKVDNQHQEFLWELQIQSWKDRRNGLSEEEYTIAVGVWDGIMKRCYSPETKSYGMYGGAGVTVCDEWKDVGNFVKWWKDNHITGWEVEKDILPYIKNISGKQYSPTNCCFMPKEINTWYASLRRGVKVERRLNGSFFAQCTVWRNKEKRKVYLQGNSYEDITEQYNMLKTQRTELHVHKLQKDHDNLKRDSPKTPEINKDVLEFLKNYDHGKYLLTF